MGGMLPKSKHEISKHQQYITNGLGARDRNEKLKEARRDKTSQNYMKAVVAICICGKSLQLDKHNQIA